MKWDCDARERRREQWHLWFAWYPVKVADGDCRWLERVWRKGAYHYSHYFSHYDCGWNWRYSAEKPE